MSPRRALALLCLALSLAWGVAQNGTADEAPSERPSERRGNMTVLRGDSALWAVTHRAGLFGFLGHEHAITAERWSATLCWIEDEPTRSFMEMRVPTASLRIDTDRGKELAGLESSPDPSTIADLQRQMLSERFLHAERFPELRFRSSGVSRPGDDHGTDVDLVVRGDLTLHGRTKPISFPVRIERASTGAFTFSVHVAFRQTDFGIMPENTIGVVAVADEMDLYLEIVALRSTASCER